MVRRSGREVRSDTAGLCWDQAGFGTRAGAACRPRAGAAYWYLDE